MWWPISIATTISCRRFHSLVKYIGALSSSRIESPVHSGMHVWVPWLQRNEVHDSTSMKWDMRSEFFNTVESQRARPTGRAFAPDAHFSTCSLQNSKRSYVRSTASFCLPNREGNTACSHLNAKGTFDDGPAQHTFPSQFAFTCHRVPPLSNLSL